MEDKYIEGAMQYRFEISELEDNKIKVGVRYEQSNENNLASFTAVKMVYDELWEQQTSASKPEQKLSKGDLKDLSIARQLINKHIEMLNNFVYNKYKDAVFTKDKPDIKIVSEFDTKHLKIKK